MSNKRAVWRNRLEAWQDSGVSAAAFCRARGLEYSQFVYWQRVLRASMVDEPRSLVPVVVQSSTPMHAMALELSLPHGVQVRVPLGFPSDEVIALVRGLSC